MVFSAWLLFQWLRYECIYCGETGHARFAREHRCELAPDDSGESPPEQRRTNSVPFLIVVGVFLIFLLAVAAYSVFFGR